MCFFKATLDQENFKKSARGSGSSIPRADSITLLYPLVVQNLLPMHLKVEDMESLDWKVVAPGDTVHFSSVSLYMPTTFRMTVRERGDIV